MQREEQPTMATKLEQIAVKSRREPNLRFTSLAHHIARERVLIVTFAAEQRLPAGYSQEEFVRAGGLMSYGIDYLALHARAAAYVDKILEVRNLRTCRWNSQLSSASASI
jgi:ABC-type uncharacterized transport system substrate-binding protein